MGKRSTYLADAMTTIPVIDCTASTRIHTNGAVPMSVDTFLLLGKSQSQIVLNSNLKVFNIFLYLQRWS